jgi:hypothetical protein
MYTKSDIEAFQSLAASAMEHYKKQFPSDRADYFTISADLAQGEMSLAIFAYGNGIDSDDLVYSKDANLADLAPSDFEKLVIDDIDRQRKLRTEREAKIQSKEDKEKQARYQQFLELQKEFGEQPAK